MINESVDLQSARSHLRTADQAFDGSDVEFHIDEGLYLLEAISVSGSAEADVAANLGQVYAKHFVTLIRQAIGAADVPEPRLKQLLTISQTIEASTFGSDEVCAVRINVAKRLVDAYLEGYSESEKQIEIDKLMRRIEAEDGSTS